MLIGKSKKKEEFDAVKQAEEAAEIAKQAFALMHEHQIFPTPENYAIWYHYASGDNKELMHEVDNITSNKLAFSDETTDYLNNKYLLDDDHAKHMIDKSTDDAQKVLADVMKAVDDIAHETHSYNKGVDKYLDTITKDLDESSVKDVLKHLVEATVELKESGNKMHQSLEESKKEVTELKKNLHQATTESQRDFLTGVYNRKTFEHLADEQMKDAKDKETDLCLLMIDIDHFKQFNDRFGHLLGDEVLKTVARTLTDILKGRDVVARFGGEEFIVTLPETPLVGALKAADIVRETISSKQLKKKNSNETYGTITVSVGVARYDSAADTLPTLIKRADEALYDSKNNGRNRVSTREI